MPSGDSTPSARNLDNRCSRSCALIIGGPSRRRFALYQKVSGTASPGPRSSRLVTLRVATKLPAPSQALACRSCHPTLFSPPAGRRMRPVKLCERGVKVPYGSMVLPGSADEKERVFGQAAARPLTTYPSARVGQAAARPLTTYPSARVGQAAARPLTTYPSARVGQAAARPLTTYPSARVGQAAARPLTTYPSARVGQAAAAAHHLPASVIATRGWGRARSPWPRGSWSRCRTWTPSSTPPPWPWMRPGTSSYITGSSATRSACSPHQHRPGQAARRRAQRLPLGHALPRHAGADRGAGAGGVRGAPRSHHLEPHQSRPPR